MYPAAADVASGAGVTAGVEAGVVTVEREVVLPGCPMNGFPGKNIDNHLCIMCGELRNANSHCHEFLAWGPTAAKQQ
jgi:hypothetical protein